MTNRWTLAAAAATLALAGAAHAQGFRADTFEYGPRTSLPEGETAEIWNPAMRKLMEGGPLIGGTVRAADPRTYCAMAAAGYDFIWTEKQHEAIDWENTARMWRTCPGPAAPGARVAYADEQEIQIATDMGALVVVVPTIDSVEEAQEAINWTYFPPLGRRSSGGGQGPGEMWNNVPGGYRQTWNDNVVLILMIETLEGVEAARDIAKLPGVDAIFAASGDLGNFSGFAEGDPEYEAIITEIEVAAQEAGIAACGPLRWAERPAYTCFQAGTEAANIRRGAQAELDAALAAYNATGAGAASAEEGETVSPLAVDIGAQCLQIVYEADCHAAITQALSQASSDQDREAIRDALTEVIANNPAQAERIREIVADSGVEIGEI